MVESDKGPRIRVYLGSKLHPIIQVVLLSSEGSLTATTEIELAVIFLLLVTNHYYLFIQK